MSEFSQGSQTPLAVFADADPRWSAQGDVCALVDAPSGMGPLIGKVRVGDTGSPDETPIVRSGSVEVADITVFRLAGSAGGPAIVDASAVVPVAVMPEVGSVVLAQALTSRALPSVLEALAFDIVLVPVTLSGDGLPVTRVFPASGTAIRALCLFSSASTLDRFLPDDDERLFTMLHGAAVVDYVAQRLTDIDMVVLDPSGPSSMTISSQVLASFIEDDTTEPVLDQSVEEEFTGVVTGFDLGLDAQWGTVDLTDPDRRERQIINLVEAQTKTLGDDAALLRRDMRQWLDNVARKSAEAGGSELGFLLTRTREAAAAVSVVTYCHALGMAATGYDALEAITDSLIAKADPDDEFVKIEIAGGEILRHSKVRRGDPRVGGENINLLAIDYWMLGPDHDHVAHVSFSTPHLEARDAITLLADNVMFNGQWTISDPSSP